MIRVGVIGGGTVGAAHAAVFRHYTQVRVYDKIAERSTHTFAETADSDVVFICLPTPVDLRGNVPIGAVGAVLAELPVDVVPILKSTVPPRQLERLFNEFPRLVFSPEFLTDRSAEYDLQQSNRFIFGYNGTDEIVRTTVNNLFSMRFPLVPKLWTSLERASLVKYATNAFFALKVAFFNELDALERRFDLTRSWPGEPSDLIDLVMMDPRIGRSHFQVPGHDGQYGFGGACFIKDMIALIAMTQELGGGMQTCKAAWKANLGHRGRVEVAAELTRLVGRSVTEEVKPEHLHAKFWEAPF